MTRHPGLVDRRELVVVVIDIQDRLASAMPRREAVEAAAARLIRAAGVLGAPVIVTRQYPRGLGDTSPGILAAIGELPGPSVAVVDKTAFCACDEPAFAVALEATGRRQPAIVGMESHICVTQTALQLARRGDRVHVCADACCSMHDEDHAVALARLSAAGVTVTTTESVMYEALGCAGTDEFRAVLELVKDRDAR